jgi:hypothetical protein
VKRRIAAAFPYAVFLLLLLVSWNRWIEPWVDSGRELMVPWRLAHGEALYRDVRFHHGPLAPYLGAAIDRLTGGLLWGRIGLAGLIALFQLEALRRIASRTLPGGRAPLATGLAVALAFFLRPGGWLFPFSFDTALAVTAVTWAVALGERRTAGAERWVWALSAAALLSRLEIGAAGLLALGFEAFRSPRRLVRLAAVPVSIALLFYALVSLGTPVSTLATGGWLSVFSAPIEWRNVYRAYAGLDRPGLRLIELALAGILVLVVLSVLSLASGVARAIPHPSAARWVEGIAVAGLLLTALVFLRPPEGLAGTVGLVPPLVRIVPIAVMVGALERVVRRLRGRPPEGVFLAVPDSVLVLAALFAARLLLAAGYAGPYNAYFLPLPAIVAAAGLWTFAERAARHVGPSLPRLTTAVVSVFLLFRSAAIADFYRGHDWGVVQTPAGSLVLPEPIAWTTRAALLDLQRDSPAGDLVGFPEGGFANYVLRRKNPTAFEKFFPGHLRDSDETAVIERLSRRPPANIFFVDVLTVGEGTPVFGRDYLPRLDRFLRENFRTRACYGPGARPEARIGDPQFFIEIRVPLSSGAIPPDAR